MAQKEQHPLLQRPLYVFDLPEEILSTITLKNQPARNVEQTEAPERTPTPGGDFPEKSDNESGPAKATSCALCNLNFPSVSEQRQHIRSDLHGYNLKQKIRGLKPVGEAEFEKLVGDLDESISGSDSEESDEEEDGSNNKGQESTLSALLKRQAKISSPDGFEEVEGKRKRGAGKPPLLWFTSPALPENMSLGVYRAIFSDVEQEEESHLVESLRRKQLSPKPAPKLSKDGGVPLPGTDIGPHYFLCMIGGGHFAAMIVALTPKKGKSHTGAEDRQATVIAHKTFHRYTTRRKQGGSQSANDNSKGAANSAGAQIRRYNEVALIQDVRNVLKEWKALIDSAELCFIRATGTTNRRTLFGPYDGQVLRNIDPRNRGFPFSTRRATQKELMRAFVELTRVKQSTVDEAALAALNAEKEKEAPATPPSQPKPEKKKPSKEEEEATLHTSQIIPLIKRSKVPALLTYIQKSSVPPSFTFVPPNFHTPTPLHLAASLNSAPVVLALLTKAGADPTIMSDDARTPFTLAGDRVTRDAFRIARHELGEAAFDWDQASVPPALSREQVAKRDDQEKAEKLAESKVESERRKAETERVRHESELMEAARRLKGFEGKGGAGKSLGKAVEKTGQEKRDEEARGLTPEARQRLERERRARAAEERMRRFAGGGGGS